jgi:hypothetical protein
VNAEADAKDEVRHRDDPNDPRLAEARRQTVEASPDPAEYLGRPENEGGRERGIDEHQNPGAPGHRRGDLERGVEPPHVELVLQVEEERPHPEAENDHAQCREHAADAGVRAVPAPQLEVADDDHHPGHPSAQEQIDGDLPAPDADQGVDQLVVTRENKVGHRHQRLSAFCVRLSAFGSRHSAASYRFSAVYVK